MTSYLFGMMKILPSRQPFVALVPRTACQICFSSPSCLHTAAITHTSTHTLSVSPQTTTGVHLCDCGYVCGGGFLKERERKLAFGAPLPAHHLWAELFKPNTHKCAHGVNALSSPFLCRSATKCYHPHPSHICLVAKHYKSRTREGG